MPRPVEAVAFDRCLEAGGDQVGDRARSLHPLGPVGVVVLAAAGLAHQGHDAGGAVRAGLGQPLGKQGLDLEGQAQGHVHGRGRAGLRGRLQHRFELVIIEAGDDRGEADADRHAGIGEPLHRIETARGRRRAGLHGAGEVAVQRRDRDEGAGQTVAAHRAQDIHIAGDQIRLGDDGEGLAESLQDLEQAARDLLRALDRLIGVGIAAYVDALADVFPRGELLFQETRSFGLEEEPAFEIQARG